MLLTRLPNGMELALLPDERGDAPDVAAVYCWMDVGSAFEPRGLEGAAHFIEHLVFKGTEKYAMGQAAGTIEGLGGDLNAWTSFEETVFHATVPSAGVEGALDVLADMLRHPRFDAEELERERKVVLEEIRGGEDDPDMVITEATWAACFAGQPYGRSVIGTMESVGALPRAGLIDFYARHYMPANGRVVVAGRFEVEHVRAAIEARFSGGPARPDHAPRRATHSTGGTTLVRRRFDSRVVRVAFPAPGHSDPTAPAFDVLATALGGGTGSPLVAELSALSGVHSVSIDYEAEVGGGLLVAEVQVSPGAVRSTLERLTGLLAGARAGGIAAADVSQARTSLMAQRLARHQSVDGRAADAGFSLAHAGSLSAWRDYDARIMATDIAEVRALAARVLDPALAQVVALAPGIRELAPKWRLRAEKPVAMGVVRERLPNGVRILVERDESALAAVRIAGLGGQLGEEPQFAGRAAMWASTVARGAGGLSRPALGRTLSGLAGSISASGGRSSSGLRLDLPSASAAAGLEYLLSVLTSPHFEPYEIELARETMLDDLAARDDDPDAQLSVAMAALAFPGHPWGQDPLGSPETLARIDQAALQRLHASWMRPANLVVAVVGNVDADAMLGRLRFFLGGLTNTEAALVPARVRHGRARQRVVLESKRDQAHVSMMFPGLSVGDSAAPAKDVLVELLSSQSGRLFTELREQRGLAYHVGAGTVEGPFGGVLTAGLGTDPARVVEAERTLAASLAAIAGGAISEAEVARSRAAVCGAVESEHQSVGVRATEIAYAELYGLDGTKYRAHARRTAGVTVEQVRAVAARLLARPTVVGRIGGAR